MRIRASQVKRHPHAHAYPWGSGISLDAADHPHTSIPEPAPKNEQVVQRGNSAGAYYKEIAPAYGELRPDKPNLKHYDYRAHEPAIDDLLKQHQYSVYYAGGKYGKPDLSNRNYNTKDLMVYDPSPGEGGDFGEEATTRSWRKIHELAHALSYQDLNAKYGEGRRIGKLGVHRTLREAKRAVEWEALAVVKQRELSEQVGHPISDEDFAKEWNTVLHDAVHRAVTGKFTNPDEEGFHPATKPVPLEVALGQLEAYAKKLGLKGEDDLLRRTRNAARDAKVPSQAALKPFVAQSECYDVAQAVADKFHLVFDTGFYVDRGSALDHAWTYTVDGTIVDTTHGQFDPRRPIGIFEPGSPEAARYISWDTHHAQSNPDRCLIQSLGVSERCEVCGKTGKNALGQLEMREFYADPDTDGDYEASTRTSMRIQAKSLSEKELQRYLNGPHQFGVISGCTGVNSKKENKDRHGELLRALGELGYSGGQIVDLRGQYQYGDAPMQAEKSVLVYDIDFNDLIALGKKFGQESVLFKDKSGTLGGYYTDGSGRMNPAKTDAASAADVRARKPKPERRGPPSKEDPWSKGRSVGFGFDIDWGTTLHYDNAPLTPDEISAQLGGDESKTQLQKAPLQEGPAAGEEGRVASARITAKAPASLRVPVAVAAPSIPRSVTVVAQSEWWSPHGLTRQLENQEAPDEALPHPRPLPHWPGVPESIEVDETANTLFDSATGKPVSPQQYNLNPNKPWEPNLENKGSRGFWEEKLRPELTPYDQTRLQRIEEGIIDAAQIKAKKRGWQDTIKELEGRLAKGETLSARDQKRLEDAKRNLEELPELQEDATLYKPEHGSPLPSVVSFSDLGVKKDDGLKNIIRVLEAATPEEVLYWRDWYKYARKDASALGQKYGVPTHVAAAIIAALSPNVKWDQNIRAAEQVLRGRGQEVIDYRKRLDDKAATSVMARLFPDLYEGRVTLGAFGYLNNIEKAQRILDSYRNAGTYPSRVLADVFIEWSPDDKKSVRHARSMFAKASREGYSAAYIRPGKPSKTTGQPLKTWIAGDEMKKFDEAAFGHRAILTPPLGSPDSAPKVTAFYESIMFPDRAQDKVVLDGHAINIWRGEPHDLTDMGNLPESQKAEMREDYQRAAEVSGRILDQKGIKGKLSPQQVQAVTWSVWREATKGVERRRNTTKGRHTRNGSVRITAAMDAQLPLEQRALIREVVDAQLSNGGAASILGRPLSRHEILYLFGIESPSGDVRSWLVAVNAEVRHAIAEWKGDLSARRASVRVTAKKGLSLTRAGYQRYRGTCNEHDVWLGAVDAVEHGSFPAGQRQKRKRVWLVKVDGIEVGKPDSIAEARKLALDVCSGKKPLPRREEENLEIINEPDDQLPGGLADGMDDEDFDFGELEEGVADEMSEHTDNPQIAKEVAKDHLVKEPGYYSKER